MHNRLRTCFTLIMAALAVFACTGCVPVAAPTASPAVSATTGPTQSPTTASPTPSPTPIVTPELTPTPTPMPTPTPTPAPTPTPDPTEPPDPAEAIVDGMTDGELLGQMVLLGFYGTADMPKEVWELYNKYRVGGVMLFGWNVKTFDQTKKMLATINGKNPFPALPMFIGIDEEGGIVHRLPWKPGTRTAATLGKRNKPQEVYDQFLRVGQKLRETGVNINLAPVLDIAPDTEGTFMGRRMYGTDPDKVIPLVTEAIRGTRDGGVLSFGKHFPGHGNTATDSHETLPVINDSAARIRDYTLKPFEAAIENGIDGLLVGHLLVPALDKKNPASLSKAIITDLLREELGFQGIVISDDMRMGAITSKYNIGEACVRFVEAGGDIVFVGKFIDKQRKALEALTKAVESGRITRDRLEDSARRIVRLKLRLLNGGEEQ